MSQILIAYFSRKGNNFVNGQVQYLPVGNTEILAKKIEELTSGDLYKIETEEPYPEDYHECTEKAKMELAQDIRPHLNTPIPDLTPYDILFIGYPNWWGTMPMPVYTFLDACEFFGKIVVPFCTHEGSGAGRTERDIRSLCAGAKIYPILSVRGSNIKDADEAIAKWLRAILPIA
ncbi:MAG: NAD(P)H-dependent oxidoreductase [Lachnospiraceae bacterium]|nr:NAD(P)H-dependent oxidoreductase [Lachnospiraceae bacterium]